MPTRQARGFLLAIASAASARGAGPTITTPCGHTQPRLYVHRLPEGYRDPGDMIGRGVGTPLNRTGMRRALGRAFPRGVQLWDSQQYNLGDLLYERALGYGCRTHDPARADLFFVPAFSGRAGMVGILRAEQMLQVQALWQVPAARPAVVSRPADALYARLRRVRAPGAADSVLEARGGADHVLFTGRGGGRRETRPFVELAFDDVRLGSATLMAHEHFDESWLTRRAGYPGPAREGLYDSVPWTSVVHLDRGARGTPWTHQPARRRSPLVAAVFMADHGAPLSLGTRKALRRSCTRHNPSVCTHMLPERQGATIGHQDFAEIAALYFHATFCLMPTGDTVSRKGVVDSLLLGCIPVLFHWGQARNHHRL